ncbi:MAG TPA: heparan-alpha-glucosaminide N-acetyltransferase domain-containing protein [Gemmataceae bacterium]|nr:heparan-alpha-glucosaminide N-acetyltransferase domain-containing protein [Gemmataceae bacterium]
MGEKDVVAKPAKPSRIEAVDLLRGLVMVIMALDHVRDFFGNQLLQDPTNLKTTSPELFFTRWITHYCAPTFIFLAGTGAFLQGARGKSKSELSWFLFTRGLWLAFFEVVCNRIFWMFNFDFIHHGAGVFWAIGWAMVVLSWLVYLPTALVAIIGVEIIALHNLLDGFSASQLHMRDWLWVILHKPGDAEVVNGITFGTGYCLIPWIGVMAAGYGFGALLQLKPRIRRQCLLFLGVVVTTLFVILRLDNVQDVPIASNVDLSQVATKRFANGYGDPSPWQFETTGLRTFLSFLNCTKYPASLLYLLMTLGPAIILLAIFDRPLGPFAKPLLVFGRVPMFYYILHIPLIHGGAVLLDFQRFGWSPLANHGPWDLKNLPPGYGVNLGYVYLIWIGVVVVLVLPCRWFDEVKRRYRSPWLSYV